MLADDPGARKTIMAGLLLKELKLRGVVDRTLAVAPAPLTVQWQVELLDKFDERFEVVSSAQVRWQLGGNAWQHYPQVVTSLDFAKRDDVAADLSGLTGIWWIVDEAHKCAAATYGDEVRKTRPYVLAEELAVRTGRLLLLTATPHSGDPNRFVNFLSLLATPAQSAATGALSPPHASIPSWPVREEMAGAVVDSFVALRASSLSQKDNDGCGTADEQQLIMHRSNAMCPPITSRYAVHVLAASAPRFVRVGARRAGRSWRTVTG